MKVEGKVSPLPWYAVGDMVIDADGNAVINECDTDEAASLVVRAVNAHNHLVAALKGLKPIFEAAESNASGNPEWEWVSKRVNAAKAALAAAKEGK